MTEITREQIRTLARIDLGHGVRVEDHESGELYVHVLFPSGGYAVEFIRSDGELLREVACRA
jgi:hypothetical protein